MRRSCSAVRNCLPVSSRTLTRLRQGFDCFLTRGQRGVSVIGSRFVLSALVAGVLFAASAGSGLASFPGVNGKIFFVARAPGGAEANHLFSRWGRMAGPDPADGRLWRRRGRWSRRRRTGGAPRDTHEKCGHLYWAQGVDLFTLNADGTGLTRLTNNCPASDSTPAWSPTGNHLVFSRSGELWSVVPMAATQRS